MKRRLAVAAAVVAAVVTLGAKALPAGDDVRGTEISAPDIAFPSGFRDWTHIKRGPDQGGVHDIYANPLAVQGYRDGVFPDGAVLVFDVVAAEAPPSTAGTPSVRTDVMVRGAEAYSATGGWGYASFALGDPARSTLPQSRAQATCHTCHENGAAPDFVFTTAPHG